jgi:hypothetical protein
MALLRLIPLTLLSSIIPYVFAHDDGPIPIGNFALPISQQPSPLFSFGQNIVTQHDALGYINPIYYRGRDKKIFLNELIALYGISDRASLFIQLPAPVINKENNLFSSGLGDLVFQGEYAYFDRVSPNSITQGTIIASILLPTGVFEADRGAVNTSPHIPFTGLGSTSFFLGTTAQKTSVNWYVFTSLGGVITTRHHQNSKIGNSFLYQVGIGRNITHLRNQVLLFLFELDGIFTNRDRLRGITDTNSGGNVIYFGPCVYYSTKRTIFQAGFQVPVYQKLNGIQPKISYQISISLAWLFNHDDYDKR